MRQTLHPQIDEQIKARLTESEAWRYEHEHSRQALQHKLRAAQLAGHDTGALIDQITAAPMDRARSIASVLHYRLQQLALPDLRHDVTWAQRTPASAPPAAHELAAALDDRARALGERLAASPEPWLARRLGVLAPGASPAMREEYTRRAGTAAAYREAAAITNPEQAVSPEPHRNQPELEAMRKAVFAALEIRDEADIIGGLDRGELEARALHGQRARTAAPPDASSQLRLTAQAEADAFQQSADARTPHDHTGAASATALAAQLAAERQRLEAHNARYEQWSADTAGRRDMAANAPAELQRRGFSRHSLESRQPHPEPTPPEAATRQPQPGEVVARREHQAAAVEEELRPPEPESTPRNNPSGAREPDGRLGSGRQPSRHDELLVRAAEAAAGRIASERKARAEFAARVDREAQAQPEPTRRAQARSENAG